MLISFRTSHRVLGWAKWFLEVLVVVRVQFAEVLLLLVSETIYRVSFLSMSPSRPEGSDLKTFGGTVLLRRRLPIIVVYAHFLFELPL